MDRIVGRNMIEGDLPADILGDFEMVNQHNYRCKNKYMRYEIGIAPQDRDKLKPGDMSKIARTFAHKMGLQNHQWIACNHKDTKNPHIHLIANRIGVDGKVFDTTFMSNRSARIAEEISREMGLTIANDVHKQKQHTESHADPARQQAKERVQQIAYSELQKNNTLEGFLYGLDRRGVGVEPAINKKGNVTVSGSATRDRHSKRLRSDESSAIIRLLRAFFLHRSKINSNRHSISAAIARVINNTPIPAAVPA